MVEEVEKDPIQENIQENEERMEVSEIEDQNSSTQEADEIKGLDADGKEPGEITVSPTLEEILEHAEGAKDAYGSLDIHVCGKCHSAFRFIPDFVQHKKICSEVSPVLSVSNKSDADKPAVWAFLLYKQFIKESSGMGLDDESAWKLYRDWSQLDSKVKNTWLQAGRALAEQYPLNSQKTNKIVFGAKTTQLAAEQHKQTLLQLQKELEDDPEPVSKTKIKKKEDDEFDSKVTHVRGMPKRAGVNQVWRKSMRKGADDMETELYTVEKIVAKRANPKIKSAEYLVKWAGLPSTQNSWEHASNLLTCKPIVEEFERNLARQKARKAADAQKLLDKQNASQTTNLLGRPQRYSAIKALDQVKEWVGKRSVEDDDYEDFAEGPKRRNIGPQKSQVVVANSRGVLNLDQNQMANLSSGVYIISDTSGYVKVDDRVASKLTQGVELDSSPRTVMINETEVRKITGNKVLVKKDSVLTPRKENNFSGQATRRILTSTPRQPVNRHILLGALNKPKTQQQVSNSIRLPKPKMSVNPARPKKMVIQDRGGVVHKIIMEDDSESNIIAQDETLPNEGEGIAVGEVEGEEGGMMRVAISPGGSLHQIVQERSKEQILVNQEQDLSQEQELLQFEGEDGVIYQLTAEQQQMLLQNGTLTMDPKQEQLEEDEEIILENGQIVRRLVGANGEAQEGEEGTFLLTGDGDEAIKMEQQSESEQGEGALTMQNIVQEAVQGARVQIATEEGNMDAHLVQAEELAPGATSRKVVLQLADGTLISTDMDEDQYQSLDIAK